MNNIWSIRFMNSPCGDCYMNLCWDLCVRFPAGVASGVAAKIIPGIFPKLLSDSFPDFVAWFLQKFLLRFNQEFLGKFFYAFLWEFIQICHQEFCRFSSFTSFSCNSYPLETTAGIPSEDFADILAEVLPGISAAMYLEVTVGIFW